MSIKPLGIEVGLEDDQEHVRINILLRDSEEKTVDRVSLLDFKPYLGACLVTDGKHSAYITKDQLKLLIKSLQDIHKNLEV